MRRRPSPVALPLPSHKTAVPPELPSLFSISNNNNILLELRPGQNQRRDSPAESQKTNAWGITPPLRETCGYIGGHLHGVCPTGALPLWAGPPRFAAHPCDCHATEAIIAPTSSNNRTPLSTRRPNHGLGLTSRFAWSPFPTIPALHPLRTTLLSDVERCRGAGNALECPGDNVPHVSLWNARDVFRARGA